MTPERRVEKRLHDRVRALGGVCIKLAPTVAGVPDRLVVLPGGRVFLVELKAPGGRLRPIQVWFHEKMASLGLGVSVLSSVEEVEGWVDRQSRGVV